MYGNSALPNTAYSRLGNFGIEPKSSHLPYVKVSRIYSQKTPTKQVPLYEKLEKNSEKDVKQWARSRVYRTGSLCFCGDV